MASDTFNLSSYMNGGRLETPELTQFKTLGDVVQNQGISPTNCVIDVTDRSGNPKSNNMATELASGDTVQIHRKSNKSG
jgi:hypothetical protein